MTRGTGEESPKNIRTYLKGISYPARKEDVIAAARVNKAPKEVIDLLKELPNQEYGGPPDVMKAYGDVR